MNTFTEAKKIQRQHPRMSWQAAIKAAGKKVRSAKRHSKKDVGASRSKKIARKKPVRTSVTTERVTVSRSIGAIHTATPAQLRAALKKQLNERENQLVLRRYRATKKTDRRKLTKEISKVKSDLRKL